MKHKKVAYYQIISRKFDIDFRGADKYRLRSYPLDLIRIMPANGKS